MSYISDSNLKQIKNLQKQLDTLSNSMLFSPANNDAPLIFPNFGSRDSAHGGQTGITSDLGIEHILQDIGTGLDTIKLQATNVIVNSTTTTALTLKNIVGNLQDGVKIFLQSPAGKTLELLTGGIFSIASNILLSDSDMAVAQYNKSSGKFKVITTSSGSGGSGANTFLSNLSSPTAVNQNLSPANDNTLDLGSISPSNRRWRNIYFQNNLIQNSQTLISSTGGATFTSLIVNGLSALNGAVSLGNAVTDVIVFSGRVASAITPITTNLYDLGTTLLRFRHAFFSGDITISDDILMNGAGSNIINCGNLDTATISVSGLAALNGAVSIVGDLTMGGVGSNINSVGNVSATTISVSGLATFNGAVALGNAFADNISITGRTIFSDVSTNPSTNGEIGRNGADAKIFSGSTLKNFTQMPQLNAANIFTTLNVFNLGITIKTANYVIFNNDDTTDTYIRQSTAIGVTPKKIDIACFSDVVFQGVGETTSARSRGMFKAFQKAGDILTTDLPSGWACAVKNTTSGQSYMAYNDAGTIKKAFFA